MAGHACGALFWKRSFHAQIFDTHIDGKWIKKTLLYVLPLLGIVVSVLSVRNILFWHAQLASDDSVSNTIIKHSLPGEPVLVISTSVPEPYPTVLLLGCQQGSRYLYAPYFAYFSSMYSDPSRDYSQYWDKDGSQQPEIAFLQELEIDIATFRPKLIMVRAGSCYACASNFDIMEFLRKIGFIRHAMADYKLISEPNAKFAVFSRVTGNKDGCKK